MTRMTKAEKKLFSKLGKKGGAAVKKKYGKEHYSKMGKKGGWPKGKKRKPETVAKPKPVIKKKTALKKKINRHDDEK